MLARWDTRVSSINFFLRMLDWLCPEIIESKNKRGRPPNHTIKEYVALIAIKEEKKSTLRRAETEDSIKVCGERVDHSVIHYWEKKLEELFIALVRKIGVLLSTHTKSVFRIIDSTKFATWKNKEIEFHTLTTITKDTVFPLSVYFGSVSPSKAVDNVLIPGKGDLMCDKWYDDNKAMSIMFERGYNPIVKPIEDRYKGYWRRKAREIFGLEWFKYRDRGRGESPYGSLTNSYGDRLKTTLIPTTRTRIAARIVSYLVKLFIRAKLLVGIFRHVPK